MMLHQNGKRQQVKVLLDTGCLVAIINECTVEKYGLEKKRHKQTRPIENYVGERVEEVGQYYTKPLLLQHQRHYSKTEFEVSPMDPEIDIFLPCSRIMDHPPQGVWTSKEIRFNSPRCLEECSKWTAMNFSLSWDDQVATHPEARIIGYVLAATSENPLKNVPLKSQRYLGLMGKEAADMLPEHHHYGCKIDLQEGATTPWGPIYPLSEIELKTLREWLTEME